MNKKDFWVLLVCSSLLMFSVGVVTGLAWRRDEIQLFTDGTPTVCKIKDCWKSSAPHSGYYAHIKYIENGQIKSCQHEISIDGLRNLKGDTYLCFVRPGHIASIEAIFSIPVKLNGNSITIDLDRSWDSDSTTVEEAMKQ